MCYENKCSEEREEIFDIHSFRMDLIKTRKMNCVEPLDPLYRGLKHITLSQFFPFLVEPLDPLYRGLKQGHSLLCPSSLIMCRAIRPAV